MWLWDASPTPGSYLVFKIMNCSLWICSKSLMPYSIQFINNYQKFLLQPLPRPAFVLFFRSPTSAPFWFCTWWEMVRNASCRCWLRLLIVLLQTIQKHKHIVNSIPITRAIPYPNFLICKKDYQQRYQENLIQKLHRDVY